MVASSSFIYVAVADLLPQLQQRLSWRDTLAQVAWLAGGLGLVLLARGMLRAARPLNARRSAAPRPQHACAAPQRTTSTGSVLCVSTFCVSLPSSSALTPRRPCEAITMRSQPCGLGVVEDRLPGVQRLHGVALAGHAGRRRRVGDGLDAGGGDALLGVEEFLRRHRLHLRDGAVGEGLLHAST